jgi:alkylation response protein AidB-like acyl-CoA dehydrogenase
MLSREQEAFRAEVREFCERVLAPAADEIDKQERFPKEILQEMGKRGYLGIPYDKKYGGAGRDTVCYALGVEEVSRVCGSTGLTMAAHTSLGAAPIYLFGNDEQKARWLPRLASGQAFGAFGLTEPGAGSDAGSTKTTAVLDSGEWIINGSKCFITTAEVAELVIITAVTEKGIGTRGISSFLVEKGTPGFTIAKRENKMGVRGSITNELAFTDCRIPKGNLLGAPGQGFKQFMQILDGGRISIAAMAVGLGQAALDYAARHAKAQTVDGKPLAEEQGIQFLLADMATELEAARLLVYDAAQRKDAGIKFTKQSAMAKLYAGTVAMRATTQAMDIIGEAAGSRNLPLERYFRDVKLCEIGEGTSQIQKLVVFREILKEIP